MSAQPTSERDGGRPGVPAARCGHRGVRREGVRGRRRGRDRPAPGSPPAPSTPATPARTLLADAIAAATGTELDDLFSDHRFEGRMEDILRVAGSHLVSRSSGGERADRSAGLLLESFAAARHEPAVLALLRSPLVERRARLAAIVEAAKASGGIDREVDTDAIVTFCHAVGLGFLLLEAIDAPLPAPRALGAADRPPRGRRRRPDRLRPQRGRRTRPPGGLTMATDEEILGREGVDDLDAILAVSRADADAAVHAVRDHADAIFTWDYRKGARPQLETLYEKAKHAQWNGEVDLDWTIEFDREEQAAGMVEVRAAEFARKGVDLAGTGLEHWGREEWIRFGMEMQSRSLSQFMHGEQGADLARRRLSRRCRGSTPSTTRPRR
ncbi:MAG: hypothetical protein R2711_06345 [Acidimicrobiales bacterium]